MLGKRDACLCVAERQGRRQKAVTGSAIRPYALSASSPRMFEKIRFTRQASRAQWIDGCLGTEFVGSSDRAALLRTIGVWAELEPD